MPRLNPTARAKTRRGAKLSQLLRRPKLLRRSAAAIGLALLCGGGFWLWDLGLPQRQIGNLKSQVVEETAEAGMVLQELLVVGRNRTGKEELLAALAVRQGQPILAFDLEDLRGRLAGLPWVKEASVGRRLPGSLLIELKEREPLALWQYRGSLALIDREGEIIQGVDPKAHAALPLIVGPDAPLHARELVALLDSEPELSRMVTAAVRVGGRRWNLRLVGDIDVQLPESGEAAAYSQLARLAREHRLLERDVRIIDLRLPDRMILHGLPGDGGGSETKPGQAT